MRLLLDTQVALWWLVGSPRLSRSCRDLIATSSCVVSVASIWEVAIKRRLGKLPIPPQIFRSAGTDIARETSSVSALRALIYPWCATMRREFRAAKQDDAALDRSAMQENRKT